MRDRKQKIKTYWGFPVEDRHPTGEDSKSNESSRGIALLIAIFLTAMMLLFTTDMIVNSTVDTRLAAASRDNVKAEYLAKSGLNLGIFLLNVDLAIDLSLYEFQGANFKPSDGPGDIWTMVNDFPIGNVGSEMMAAFQEGFNLSKINDSGLMDKLNLFDGFFTLNITDEKSRININNCGYARVKGGQTCVELLQTFFSCPAEREYFERNKIKPKEIIGFIVDWADNDTNPHEYTQVGSESDPYDDLQPKVSPKNSYFESLDELKMIPGWDDNLHRIFSPYLTVYPVPKDGVSQSTGLLNINTIDRALSNCLFPKSTNECAEQSALYANKREENPNVASSADMKDIMNRIYCSEDATKSSLFTFRSDLYRLNVVGTVGDQNRRLEVIVKRGIPDEIDRKDGFVGAYNYLYWKML